MKDKLRIMLWFSYVCVIFITACGKSQGEKERSDYFSSQCSHVDSIWNFYTVENDPEEYISMICNAQGNLAKRGFKDSSLKLLRRLDGLALKRNDPKIFTYVYLNRAFDAMLLGELDSAMKYYKKRKPYAGSADEINVLMANQFAGNYYYMIGEIDSAKSEFVDGYNHSREKGDTAMMYNFALNSGTIYFDLNLTSMAKHYFSEAYVIGSKKSKVSLMLVNNLVATLIAEKKYKEALKLCEDNQASWMNDSLNNGSNLLKLNYAWLLNQQDESKRAESILKLVQVKSVPGIHVPYYYSNLLVSLLNQNKTAQFKSVIDTLSPFIYSNQPRSFVEMNSILMQAIDRHMYEPNLDSLTSTYNSELKQGTDYYSSSVYCDIISKLLKTRGDNAGAARWENLSIKHQLELSKAKESLQMNDIENEIAQKELNYNLSTKQRNLESKSMQNRVISIALVSSLVVVCILIFTLRLLLRTRKKRSQIHKLETDIRESEILALQKEKELKEKTITLAQSVLVQVSKLSERIKNSSFSKDPDALFLRQDLERLSELSTSISELEVQNDFAYNDFDYLFDKIPSLASLNQTERKILILTVIGSKPKEIGSVLNLNDQYIRNVKSKIKKLLPEELQNAEWEQLRKLDLV